MKATANKFIGLVLIAVMALLPIRINADEPVTPADPGPPQQTWVAVCIVVGVGLAVTAIYLVNKKCKPKYYWLCDDDVPPRTWVGTATDKECKINDWKKIGGPYDRPEDAPTNAPPITNIVHELMGPVMHHVVEQSNDGENWTAVHEEDCTQEDFGYIVPATNQAALFRLRVGP